MAQELNYLELFGMIRSGTVVQQFTRAEINGGQYAVEVEGEVKLEDSGPYQNVENPDYKVSKGLDYVTRHMDELRRMPSLHSESVDFSPTSEFNQLCRNLYNQTMMAKQDPDLQASMSRLPIWEVEEELVRKIRKVPVMLLYGKTGCGKSTLVPQFILDDCMLRDVPCRIFVTQPRRMACMTLAEHVCRCRGWPLGKMVGYQVGGDKSNISDESLIRFVTPGLLLRQIKHFKSPEIRQMTHIIVDEVHERTADVELLLILLRRLLAVNKNLRLILMSATFDQKKFEDYFGCDVFRCDRALELPSMRVNVEMFEVEEFWLGSFVKDPEFQHLKELYKEEFGADFDKNDAILYNWVVDCALTIIARFKLTNDAESIVSDEERARGSVLVFLPGYSDIETFCLLLGKMDPSRNKWTIVPVHSKLKQEAERTIFAPPMPGYRKIIVSTNIAESSITIPDVKYIIDFGLTKRSSVDKVSNLSFLKLVWCSQAEIKQRRGRAGRVQRGKVYHMIPLELFHDLPEEPPPEITTTPLTRLTLMAKSMSICHGAIQNGIQKYLSPKQIFAEALTSPEEQDIDLSILTLKELGGLTLSNGRNPIDRYDGEITFLGRLMDALPIDPHLSRLVAMGIILGVLDDCLRLAALLSVETVFTNRFKADVQRYYARLWWADGSFSDLHAMLRLYEKFCLADDPKVFCEESDLDFKTMREVVSKHADLSTAMELSFPIISETTAEINMSDEEKDLLLKIACFGAFYPNYFSSETLKTESEINRALKTDSDPRKTVVLSGLPINSRVSYADQVTELLQAVSNNVQVKQIDSKCYATFDTCLSEPMSYMESFEKKQLRRFCDVDTSVFLAQKMWNPEFNPFQIRVYNDDGAPIVKRMKFEDDIEPVTIPKRDLSRLRRNTALKEMNPMFDIVVGKTEDPSHFWARRYIDKIGKILRNIENHQLFPVPHAVLRPGMGILVPHFSKTLQKDMYYRAEVLSYTTISGCRWIYARLTETGIDVKVRHEDTRMYTREIQESLPSELQEWQAFPCALAETAPYMTSNTEKKYSRDAISKFEELTSPHNARLLIKIFSVEYGVAKVFLYVRPDNDVSPTIVQSILYRECLASRVEESELSKKDAASFKSYAKGVESEDSAEESREMSGLTIDHEIPHTEVIDLRGPWSVLRHEYHALAFQHRQRQAKVQRESVNSIALDVNCGRGTENFLVAAHVSLDGAGEKLIASNTVAINWKPGKQFLMTILFAPAVEFRIDAKQERIVGVLCGLRYEVKDGKPIALFPDHEIELEADVEVSLNDIHLANAIRAEFNKLLCLTRGMEHAYVVRRSSQKKLMAILKEFMDTPRFRMNEWLQKRPKTTFYPHRWQELKRNGCSEMEAVEEANPGQRKDKIVFQPHAVPQLMASRRFSSLDVALKLQNLAALQVRAFNRDPGVHDVEHYCNICIDRKYDIPTSLPNRNAVCAHLNSEEHQDNLDQLLAAIPEIHEPGVRVDVLENFARRHVLEKIDDEN